MPYMAQWSRDVHNKLKELDERTKPKAEEEAHAPTGFMNDGAGNPYLLANEAYGGGGYGMAPPPVQMMQHPPYGGGMGFGGGGF